MILSNQICLVNLLQKKEGKRTLRHLGNSDPISNERLLGRGLIDYLKVLYLLQHEFLE